MSNVIRDDLSRNLQQRLGSVLEREAHVATHVLDVADLGIIMVEAAMMMARSAAATMGGHAATDEDATVLYNHVIDTIVAQLETSRADGLSRTMAERRKRAA